MDCKVFPVSVGGPEVSFEVRVTRGGKGKGLEALIKAMMAA